MIDLAKYKRRALAAGGIFVIAVSLFYISQPVGHIPPYDANLTRLAESQLQGYCAGKTFWISGGVGDAGQASLCRQQLKGKYSDKPNLRQVQPAFCQAIVDEGWAGTVSDCLAIMSQNEYWPTYDGGITNSWNRARPYPVTIGGSSVGSQNGGSRTGGHQGNTRANAPGRSY